jgi:CRISPR-associated exonuclease Cas4
MNMVMAIGTHSGIPEEDYLQLSGIQHFSFCRRQWALIHIENQWAENLRTFEGGLMHERAHDPFFTEKRKDLIVAREMPVFSREMGVSGQCDVVEFRRDEASGVSLSGRRGKWSPCPIEYKRGKPKITDADRLQLCAQAICLEEMLACDVIEMAYLYYGETRRREPVELTDALRGKVRSMFAEMHQHYRRGHTPRVKQTKSCNACSMKDICLPKLPRSERFARNYIAGRISSDIPEGIF